MITIDHPHTATVIAWQIGITWPGAKDEASISGRELATYTDRERINVARHTSVFARVTPEQKLRLVEALQANGEVVTMTEYGLNDRQHSSSRTSASPSVLKALRGAFRNGRGCRGALPCNAPLQPRSKPITATA